jgi:hypothetical protein
MVVLLWQMFDTTNHSGKSWIFVHNEALMLMAGGNFGRHTAYWLYCYELLKIARLMPKVVNKDFSSTRDPLLNFQKKKTRQNLLTLNVFMIVLFACVIMIHMASSSFAGVMITYVPQVVQVFALGHALVHIRGCLSQLSEASKGTFEVNERHMYAQMILSTMALITGLFANLLTLKAKVVPLDNDSIGSQERYYNTWMTPVYMWSLHYIMMIGFIVSVMQMLKNIASAAEG